MTPINNYYDRDQVANRIASNGHRKVVGGLWDELGALQLRALEELGLKSHHTVLDVGCGSLRAGRLLVDYLAPGKYHGVDLNQSLLDAGFENELTPQLQDKLPRSNLVEHDVTQTLPFDGTFDFLVAFSLFTHLPVELSEACLRSVAEKMHDGSTLLATFFLTEEEERAQARASGIRTFPDRDPFHVSRATLQRLSERAGLQVAELPQFSHPRDQSLCVLRKP